MTTTKTPTPPVKKFGRLQNIGLAIFAISNSFCADEMIPGWQTFHLGWPVSTYYLISIIGGAIGGALFGGRYFLPGLIGGAIAGPGALYAVGRYLASVNVSYSTMEGLWACLGALPGLVIGIALRLAQNALAPAKP